jgi:hypothetical protein
MICRHGAREPIAVAEGRCAPFALVCNGLQWFAMVCNGLQWFAMVCNGLQWFAMVCNGLQWFAMVCQISNNHQQLIKSAPVNHRKQRQTAKPFSHSKRLAVDESELASPRTGAAPHP